MRQKEKQTQEFDWYRESKELIREHQLIKRKHYR